MTLKKHNPKSSMPAVYIPCWLIQIPHNLLSYGAKLVYGRLAQWCSSSGIVYRSSPQLSKELGMGERTVERFINELKAVSLIGTYHPQAGGINHFEFYDHPWMYENLSTELCYESLDPPPHLAVPPASPGGTLPPHLAGINNKEIEEIKNPPLSPKGGDAISPDKLLTSASGALVSVFESFWEIYPSKRAKKKCQEIWKRRKLDAIADCIIERLNLQIKNDEQWKNGYMPNPSTYLNQDRWEDEVTSPKNNMQAKNKVEADKKQADLEKTSQQRAQEQIQKYNQHKQDSKIYNVIQAEVLSNGKKQFQPTKHLLDILKGNINDGNTI